MKYFLTIFLLLAPFQSQAHLLIAKKWELVEQANKHQELAKQKLGHFERVTWWIPDIEKKEHIRNLIGTTIASSMVSNPKEKFLTIGLGLIASLAQDMYDNYCLATNLLVEISFHLEQYNFYNELSINVNSYLEMDYGTKEFLSSIDNLTKAEMYASCILCEDEMYYITKLIADHKKYMIKQFNNKEKWLPQNIYNESVCFMENITEVTAELLDWKLTEKINLHVCCSVDDLESACDHWDIDIYE